MPKARTVEIHEGDDSLEIFVDWDRDFSSAFFAVALVTLLGSVAMFNSSGSWGDAAPWILSLLVSSWILYSTICMKFNYTSFEVKDDILRVAHGPLPWWQGSRMIGIEEVDQLFVHEEKRISDGEDISSYTIHAVLVDGSRKPLLFKSPLKRAEALEVEQKLEEYLGIADREVPGELPGKNPRRPMLKGRRQPRRSYADPVLEKLYRSLRNKEVLFDGRQWHLEKTSQLDWLSGDSDRFLLLRDADKNEYQVYISENKTFLHAFRETELPKDTFSITTLQPPTTLEWEGRSYELHQQQKGKVFGARRNRFRRALQWIYETTDRERHLRIIHIDGRIRIYAGELVLSPSPIKGLELEDLPEEEHEFLQRGWEGEDIV